MSSKYFGPIKWLGGIALILFAFAIIFPIIGSAIFSEETRKGVFINAIPFFSAFIGILLLFILLIVLVARRYNGKVPARCHSAIERTLVIGILFGVFFLFQPFSIVPYRYGFLLLLVAILAFILWSHVVPAGARQTFVLPQLNGRQHLIGGIAALIVVVVMSAGIIGLNAPQEPYGIRDRVWKSYSDERKAEVAAAATGEFSTVETPFIILLSLFPAAVVYFAAREIGAEPAAEESLQSVQAVSHA
ncbi:MAG: hypothetical protein GC179_11645 [Anaerolineaceae bacterium]|nr:hypothetical protein [Anaerolineaceae bacterium]